MQYKKTETGVFLERPNRFIAEVELNGTVETVHVKNTGRCRELLIPGTKVVLAEAENPARKTRYDLITVWKEGRGWVNLDSQAPNAVVKEWLEAQTAGEPEFYGRFPGISYLKTEYTYGQSRIDFYFEYQGKRALMEVKGVTLERDGVCYFPDAPTERGVKHLKELTAAVKAGYECYAAFVLQMEGVTKVRPNDETHPAFGEALREAQKAGIKVLALGCHVTENTLEIDRCSNMERTDLFFS